MKDTFKYGCFHCGSTGWLIEAGQQITCPKCEGKGYRKHKKTGGSQMKNLPPGVNANMIPGGSRMKEYNWKEMQYTPLQALEAAAEENTVECWLSLRDYASWKFLMSPVLGKACEGWGETWRIARDWVKHYQNRR